MIDSSSSTKAQDHLNAILENKPKANTGDSEVSVEDARRAPILVPKSNRTQTRVLFVTTDVAILTQTKKTLDGFIAIADVFHEVHIIVMRTGLPVKNKVLRVDDNTWVYTATATHQWQLPFAAWQMMQDQLVFAEGFRPDIIVARDTGISAVVTYAAGMYYDRPTQLHIEDKNIHNDLPLSIRMAAKWAVRHFKSVRVHTESDRDMFMQKFPGVTDVEVLPRFRNYSELFSAESERYLQKRYPQFNFIIVYIGDLTEGSTAFQAIDAVRAVLRNPRVGFLIVGNGMAVSECERRAELLGISNQVVIERHASEHHYTYIADADILLVTDKNDMADEVVLHGAAAGAPMIMTETPLRNDLFVDGVSAFVVSDVRSPRMSDLFIKLLNNPAQRMSMGHAAKVVADTRLHDDPVAYKDLYRASVEYAISMSIND